MVTDTCTPETASEYTGLPLHIDGERYAANLWDWTTLEGCFATSKIRPTDIDGALEWKGNVLLLETKAPNAWLTYGQRALYQALVAKGVTVLVVWGEPNRPREILLMKQSENVYYPDADMQTLKRICRSWSLHANANPKPLPGGFPKLYPRALECRLPGNPPLSPQ